MCASPPSAGHNGKPEINFGRRLSISEVLWQPAEEWAFFREGLAEDGEQLLNDFEEDEDLDDVVVNDDDDVDDKESTEDNEAAREGPLGVTNFGSKGKAANSSWLLLDMESSAEDHW